MCVCVCAQTNFVWWHAVYSRARLVSIYMITVSITTVRLCALHQNQKMTLCVIVCSTNDVTLLSCIVLPFCDSIRVLDSTQCGLYEGSAKSTLLHRHGTRQVSIYLSISFPKSTSFFLVVCIVLTQAWFCGGHHLQTEAFIQTGPH